MTTDKKGLDIVSLEEIKQKEENKITKPSLLSERVLVSYAYPVSKSSRFSSSSSSTSLSLLTMVHRKRGGDNTVAHIEEKCQTCYYIDSTILGNSVCCICGESAPISTRLTRLFDRRMK